MADHLHERLFLKHGEAVEVDSDTQANVVLNGRFRVRQLHGRSIPSLLWWILHTFPGSSDSPYFRVLECCPILGCWPSDRANRQEMPACGLGR